MGGHDQLRAGLDARAEGNHFAGGNLRPAFLREGVAVVRVGQRVPVAGEMLQGGGGAGLLHAPHVGGDQRRSLLRVVAERARADDDVFRIGVDVRHGGEVDVEAVLLQILSDAARRLVRGLRARGRQRGGAFGARHVEGRIVRQAAHASAFFVDAEQGTARQGAKVLLEAVQLFCVLNVMAVKQNAAHGIFAGPRPHSVADRL